ncbi:hypothetical protein ON010_g14861 [Phytophthora cinnamomi]|nr:hypothetical protein ON010_g14861 [Phytophthora cinnamomi]
MTEQSHETHVEATLTADIPPQVRLRERKKKTTRAALFEDLYSANCDSRNGQAMVDSMKKAVKVLYFDGHHTLKFVFNSRRIAEYYNGIVVRLQHVVIDLEDAGTQEDGAYKSAQLRRCYSIGVLVGTDLGIATLGSLSQLSGVAVPDTERPRLGISSLEDNRYFLVRFDHEHCPEELRGVTQEKIGDTQVVVHQHLLHKRQL